MEPFADPGRLSSKVTPQILQASCKNMVACWKIPPLVRWFPIETSILIRGFPANHGHRRVPSALWHEAWASDHVVQGQNAVFVPPSVQAADNAAGRKKTDYCWKEPGPETWCFNGRVARKTSPFHELSVLLAGSTCIGWSHTSQNSTEMTQLTLHQGFPSHEPLQEVL